MMRRGQRLVCWILVQTMVLSPCGVYAQEALAGAAKESVDPGYITPNAVVAAVAYPRRVLTAPEAEQPVLDPCSSTDLIPLARKGS